MAEGSAIQGGRLSLLFVDKAGLRCARSLVERGSQLLADRVADDLCDLRDAELEVVIDDGVIKLLGKVDLIRSSTHALLDHLGTLGASRL